MCVCVFGIHATGIWLNNQTTPSEPASSGNFSWFRNISTTKRSHFQRRLDRNISAFQNYFWLKKNAYLPWNVLKQLWIRKRSLNHKKRSEDKSLLGAYVQSTYFTPVNMYIAWINLVVIFSSLNLPIQFNRYQTIEVRNYTCILTHYNFSENNKKNAGFVNTLIRSFLSTSVV